MTPIAESAMSDAAMDYVRAHQKRIAAEAVEKYSTEQNPISIFMAGSPGAGKTETSKKILDNHGHILRIDADELREHFRACGYNGTNSHVFQQAANRLVHALHDAALKKRISFLMDGTFANENNARTNIERSLSPKRNRRVFVLFIYQSPMAAWEFVQKREIAEGRRILAEDFVKKFCASQLVANKMKSKFNTQIELSLIVKNIDGTNRFLKLGIQRLDDHLQEKYTADEILELIRGDK